MRYIGIIYSAMAIVAYIPSIPLTDKGCAILGYIQWRTFVVINVMLGVIMIHRLHAMYQRSRKMLIFLILTFATVTIASVVIVVIHSNHLVWDEVILSGIYYCVAYGSDPLLRVDTWILNTVWEALALCLAIRIAVKHFLELQRSSIGWGIGDCFTVLMKTHVLYFAAFAAVSFCSIGMLSSNLSNSAIYSGILRIASLVQMFVLGPRLILDVRQYHAKLTTNSDEGASMTTIAFQEHVLVLSSRGDV